MGVSTGVIVGCLATLGGSAAGAASIAVVVVVLGICAAKGTSPGGPTARREFERWRSRQHS